MKQEEVWDIVAEKWADFRVRSVDEVVSFLDDKSGKVLDLGCGSGRNSPSEVAGCRLPVAGYGVDFSEKLLEIAGGKSYVELKKGEVDAIPYGDGFFDFVVFVRALHCVEGEEKRRKALGECFRVLRKGGEMMVSVWARGSGRVKNREKESYVPWTVDGKIVERFTYLYDVEELRGELEDVGFVVKNCEVGKNIVFVVRKS